MDLSKNRGANFYNTKIMTLKIISLAIEVKLILLLILTISGCASKVKNDTLRISAINPRYFTDHTGKAIYLTGSHTWDNLVDMTADGQGESLDFDRYLDFLKFHNHNFIRLWAWDILNWDTRRNRSRDSLILQMPQKPWPRVGPGLGLDGRPKFDLSRFDQKYFDRLKERVAAASEAKIYVGVMLFEGWGAQFSPNAFTNHPFHPSNNVNGIDMDISHDSLGVRIYELGNDRITELQEMYVRKVIETVGGFENVLYEISNENHPASTDWQYHMIRFIKAEEAKAGLSHPVGMTYQWKGGTQEALFESPADWISPGREGDYKDNPPVNDGGKVILTDTDHLWGTGGNRKWVWKSFMRGLNPIFMDPYQGKVLNKGEGDEWEQEMRVAMGKTKEFAERIDLIHMAPVMSFASSGYCLMNEGKEYLVYIPEGGQTDIDLTGVNGTFSVQWHDPLSGFSYRDKPIKGGMTHKLILPFELDDVLIHLKRIAE